MYAVEEYKKHIRRYEKFIGNHEAENALDHGWACLKLELYRENLAKLLNEEKEASDV